MLKQKTNSKHVRYKRMKLPCTTYKNFEFLSEIIKLKTEASHLAQTALPFPN